MGLKNKCCKSYKKKGKACKSCPVIAIMAKKEKRKFLHKFSR